MKSSFMVMRGADSGCRSGFAFETRPSRALPGHRQINVLRLGVGTGGLDEGDLEAGVARLAALARSDRSVLRVTVELFSIDPECLHRSSHALARHGFVQRVATRTYERTLLVDLAAEEDALLARFHKNARQGIRNVARHPVKVTIADSVSLADRLQELGDETRLRTGGEPRGLDWDSIIRLSAEAPHLSRIAMLERTDREGPGSVLAFAWGCVHGEVAEYCESGSARVDDLKVSTSYALLWDLISWARRSGARIFDLGGITEGSTGSTDPLGGISDFKRRFSQAEAEVGQEWLLEPHPSRTAAATLISRAAAVLRRSSRRSGD